MAWSSRAQQQQMWMHHGAAAKQGAGASAFMLSLGDVSSAAWISCVLFMCIR
jgi:hypothetical protein